MFGFFKKIKEGFVAEAAEQAVKAENLEFNNQAILFSDIIDIAKDFTFVKFNGTKLSVTHDNYFDASLALKELRVLKKKATVKKREITAEYKEIRDEYNQSVGNRSSLALLTGTGKFGTFARAGVRAARANARGRMADIKQKKEDAVAPWDSILDSLERAIIIVESAKIKYEVESEK